MPITNQELWGEYIEKNQEPYGRACIMVAERVMEILDEEQGPIDTHKIICRADDDTKAGGLTGFMAGAVACMVSECHGRGEEFRRLWNTDRQINHEGDKANEGTGVLNPALVTISLPDAAGA